MKTLPLFAVCVSLFLSAQAFAGITGDEKISCKSKDGFSLSGVLPGDDINFALDLGLNGKTVKIYSNFDDENLPQGENAEMEEIEHLDEGVLTLATKIKVNNEHGSMYFYAIPKTVRFSGNRNADYKATFTARVQVQVSSLSEDLLMKTVDCAFSFKSM